LPAKLTKILGLKNTWLLGGIRFIQPGRPMQNGFIERFNRSYRQDVLDASVFSNLAEVKMWSDEFEQDYNEHRPHESLGNLSPLQYKQKHQQS
jgi:putative transposase